MVTEECLSLHCGCMHAGMFTQTEVEHETIIVSCSTYYIGFLTDLLLNVENKTHVGEIGCNVYGK